MKLSDPETEETERLVAQAKAQTKQEIDALKNCDFLSAGQREKLDALESRGLLPPLSFETKSGAPSLLAVDAAPARKSFGKSLLFLGALIAFAGWGAFGSNNSKVAGPAWVLLILLVPLALFGIWTHLRIRNFPTKLEIFEDGVWCPLLGIFIPHERIVAMGEKRDTLVRGPYRIFIQAYLRDEDISRMERGRGLVKNKVLTYALSDPSDLIKPSRQEIWRVLKAAIEKRNTVAKIPQPVFIDRHN